MYNRLGVLATYMLSTGLELTSAFFHIAAQATAEIFPIPKELATSESAPLPKGKETKVPLGFHGPSPS